MLGHTRYKSRLTVVHVYNPVYVSLLQEEEEENSDIGPVVVRRREEEEKRVISADDAVTGATTATSMKCDDCDEPIVGTYYEKNGKNYCEKDYQVMLGYRVTQKFCTWQALKVPL